MSPSDSYKGPLNCHLSIQYSQRPRYHRKMRLPINCRRVRIETFQEVVVSGVSILSGLVVVKLESNTRRSGMNDSTALESFYDTVSFGYRTNLPCIATDQT